MDRQLLDSISPYLRPRLRTGLSRRTNGCTTSGEVKLFEVVDLSSPPRDPLRSADTGTLLDQPLNANLNPYDPPYSVSRHAQSRPVLRSWLLIAGIMALLVWLVVGAITFVPESQWIGNATSIASLSFGIASFACRALLKR